MSGKYKINKVKQEHTIIEDILPLLEDMARHPSIKSIIPGRINRRSGSGVEPHLQIKYETSSGIKLQAKNSSSIQEVFVVADKSQRVLNWLKKSSKVRC
ncbi:DUF2103 domain-containing protein [Halarsenatibacter silvermanii]|uniref:Predicted metal-binding protein n=1 Tax=Halarsenatibacter silvermanii TaxID=321763 RepID=A0A1G9LN74_9FIRM|nr:DUF2103 domain-containing protein [Halarsenatibacter silvermanii]SDL62955.1 Predicted metal-binding protein [Halarsenatibacter silvermanii]